MSLQIPGTGLGSLSDPTLVVGRQPHGKTLKHLPSGIPTIRESNPDAEFGGGPPSLFDAWKKNEII
jgi:hypothetical protein